MAEIRNKYGGFFWTVTFGGTTLKGLSPERCMTAARLRGYTGGFLIFTGAPCAK